MTIADLCQRHGLSLEVEKGKHDFWAASFYEVEMQDGDILMTAIGFGKDRSAAVADLCSRISGKVLVANNSKEKYGPYIVNEVSDESGSATPG